MTPGSPWKFNSSPLKISRAPKGKQSSNHHFSEAVLNFRGVIGIQETRASGHRRTGARACKETLAWLAELQEKWGWPDERDIRDDTVDGNLANQLRLVTYAHYLQGFIHPRWLFGISSITSMVELVGTIDSTWPSELLPFALHWRKAWWFTDESCRFVLLVRSAYSGQHWAPAAWTMMIMMWVYESHDHQCAVLT